VQGRPFESTPFVIVMPTLNEVEGVRATIGDIPFRELREAGFDPEVVVIDGRSTDGTQRVAAELGATVLVQTGRGKGAAVREALEWAEARQVPYVAVMDADFTYPGAALPTLATLLAAGSEMVVGVRRPDRHAMSELRGLVHRVGNGMLNFLAGYLARGTILDVCSGLWGVRTEVLPKLALVSEGFDIEAEAFVKAFRQGLAVSQFPVVYRDRVGIAKLHAFKDGSRILLSILRYSGYARVFPGGREGPSIPQTGPLPASTVRDLQSILFALNNRRVFVSGATAVGSSVDAVVNQLRDISPDLQVDRVSAHPKTPAPVAATENPPAGNSDSPWSLVITLPDGPLRRVGQSCTIRVPDGERMIYVDLAPPAEPETSEDFSRSRAYRLEHSSDRRFSSLRFLSSSLAQFPGQRDLALIEANVAHSDFTIYRARTRAGPVGDGVPVPPLRTVLADGDSSGLLGDE
jgi:dolichol-phosphate hexosyltransferase